MSSAEAALPPTLVAGSLLAERYKVLGLLGSGGMGAVYRVEHAGMGKVLALKLLKPELSQLPSVVERFEREARSAARLDHPGIVRVTDFGKLPDGALYMAMELVEGRPLSDLVAAGRVPVDRALALVAQILAALEHAHQHGVIHRDIKPANVMVTADGRAKLVDFGIAKLSAGEESTLTQHGAVVGTPRYMSPEQAAGEAIDLRTDLYSTGVVLFELLTGRPPFVGASSVEVLSKHLTQAPPPLVLESEDPARALALARAVARALEKPRERRFASAREFLDALGAVGQRVPPLVLAWHRARAAIRRRPQLSAGVAVVLGIVALTALASGGGATSSADALIARGEEALARGDLAAARALALQAAAEAPEAARAHLLQATLALAEDHPEVALTSLGAAIARDRALTADPLVEAAVRAQVSRDSPHAAAYLAIPAEQGDARSAPLLAELAKTAPKPALRRDAFAGLERLGETERLDVLTWLTEELEKNARQSCTTRKWYAYRLIGLHDARTLATLEKELGRRGGFLNLSSESDCMARELRAEIKALKAAASPAPSEAAR